MALAKFVQYDPVTGLIGAVIIGDSSRVPVHPSQLILAANIITDGMMVDTVNKVLIAIPLPAHPVLALRDFLRRFTAAERAALEGLAATGTQNVKNQLAAFFRYVQADNTVDCGDNYIQTVVQTMEAQSVIATGRAAQILGN